MASKLYFPIAEILPILDHAEAAPKQDLSLDQLFDKRLWKPGTVVQKGGYCKEEDIDFTKVPAQLFLVKDQGVYLMSAGTPRQLVPGDTERSVASYANQCDPAKDEDWWANASAMCGGDDFSISIPASILRQGIASKAGATRLCINFGKQKLTFTVN